MPSDQKRPWNYRDLTGLKFGKLLVISPGEKPEWSTNKKKCIYWLCQCECGARPSVEAYCLTSGNTKSCGHRWMDVKGRRFGRWLVVGEKPGLDNHTFSWMCKCDCGVERMVSAHSLIRGRSRSCGCLRVDSCSGLQKEPGYSARLNLFHTYKVGSKSRGLELALSQDEVVDICLQPCHYCGAAWSSLGQYRAHQEQFPHNGIDRVDNSKGYVPGNVVPCCKICNRAKNSMSKREFLEWAERVFLHQSSAWTSGGKPRSSMETLPIGGS